MLDRRMLSIITEQELVLYFKVDLQTIHLSYPAHSPTNLAISVRPTVFLSAVGMGACIIWLLRPYFTAFVK